METFFVDYCMINTNIKKLKTELKVLDFFSEQYYIAYNDFDEREKNDKAYVNFILCCEESYEIIKNIASSLSNIVNFSIKLNNCYCDEFNAEVNKQVDNSIDLYELDGTKDYKEYNKSTLKTIFDVEEFKEYLEKATIALYDIDINLYHSYVKYLNIICKSLENNNNKTYEQMHNTYNNVYKDNQNKVKKIESIKKK